MKLFRNVIDDAIEYNKHIAKYNEKNEFVKLAPIKEEKVITITLDEYKELLVYKGKYLGLTGINKNNIGARYIDINYCPFCGRKLSDD
ncbi:MAG: hypothetical protein UFD82_04540 [Bacilli bacterium]|jgi:hypothetical protein|nr:hypothetical protein [Bacilli bacterium]